ncbi:hypothetical protein BDW74DRAFT_172826 [Aspergillus multicolor]|uniref:uncharacterized protein n=1 Tax=Aspergillus multicolor TaxID=41759 RepID=UPI003CCE2893
MLKTVSFSGYVRTHGIRAGPLQELAHIMIETPAGDVVKALEVARGDESYDEATATENVLADETEADTNTQGQTILLHDDLEALSSDDRVDFLNRINSYKCTKTNQITKKVVSSGNSRDAPSAFLFRCPVPGCSETREREDLMRQHTIKCEGPDEVSEEQVSCKVCSRIFPNAKSLSQHMSRLCGWVHKLCNRCPGDATMYSSYAEYKKHQESKHSPSSMKVVEGRALICPEASCKAKNLQRDYTREDLFKGHSKRVHLYDIDKQNQIFKEVVEAQKENLPP